MSTSTSQDNTEMENIAIQLDEVSEKYLDDLGYVSSENMESAVDEVYKLAEKLLEEGIITYLEKNENNIYYELPSGVGCTYVFPEFGTASAGTEHLKVYDLADFLNDDEIVYTYGEDGFLKQFKKDFLESIDCEAKVSYQDSVSLQSPATSDSLKWLASDSVLCIFTHGYYTNKYGTSLLTGVKETKELDKEYWYDLEHKYLIYSSISGEDGTYYTATPAFFETYIHDNALEGAIIYLGACSSAKDLRLINAFLGKGANAVLGFTDIAYVIYVDYMSQVIVNLATPGLSQEIDYIYPTVYEALLEARNVYGEYDNMRMLSEDCILNWIENLVEQFGEENREEITQTVMDIWNTVRECRLVVYGNANKKLVDDMETCFDGGTGTEANPYQVHSVENLERMEYLIQNGETFDGIYIQLENDIDVTGFSGFTTFSGIFDGNGHKITGLQLSSHCHGLFNETNHAVIKNLTIEGEPLVLEADGTCPVVGVFVGEATLTTIENCVNKCDVSSVEGITGGIAGEIVASRIINCENYGTIMGDAVGGIVGIAWAYKIGIGDSPQDTVIENCTNYGTVIGQMGEKYNYFCVGGIVGCAEKGYQSTTVKLIQCINNGKVYEETESSTIGGIVGYGRGIVISACINYGEVAQREDDTAGGIAGWTEGGEVSSCEHHGTSTSGNLIGYTSANVIIDGNCVNTEEKETEVSTQETEESEQETTETPTEASTEEETTEEPIKITISGLYENFDNATVAAGRLSYIINVSISGNVDEDKVKSIISGATLTVKGPIGVSSELDYSISGNGGIIYATVSWTQIGTYSVTLNVGGTTASGIINVVK